MGADLHLKTNPQYILTGVLVLAITLLTDPALLGLGRPALLGETRSSAAQPALTFIDTAAVRSGDLIFRRGHSLRSRAVLVAEHGVSPFSHVGMADRTSDGLFVINASPAEGDRAGKVVREPIQEFLAPGEADTATVIRVADSVTAMRATVAARRYAADSVPFDGDFDLATPNAVYCTELVWRSYEAAGIDVSGGRRDTVHVLTRTYTMILPAALLARGRPDHAGVISLAAHVRSNSTAP